MKRNTNLVIGYFGYRTNQLDGQTIKTRNLYNLLQNKISNVEYFDTQDFQYGVKNIFFMLKKILKCKTLYYLPAHNNLKYIFPFIFILSKLFRFNILYFIIGGWLDIFLENKPIHVFLLKKIKVMLAESIQLKSSLMQKYKFDNVEILPNFRINVPDIESCGTEGEFNIVFMARICEDKGINVIFRFAEYIESRHLINNTFPIHIKLYGMLDCLNNESDFWNNLKKYSFIEYGGIIDMKDVYKKLSENDVLVLPTRYPGEGLPGSIIEAYIAGLPVVVSNWRFLPEFVEHGKTGFIYDLNNEIDFYTYLLTLYNDKDLLSFMKRKAKIKGYEYTECNAWNIISKYIENDNCNLSNL